MRGMSVSIEACSLDLFNISMETPKTCYLHGVANFLSQEGNFKLVGFLLFTLLRGYTDILEAKFSISPNIL